MMNREIRTIAVQVAVLVLFVLAIVSWCYGCSPGKCAARAVLGAAVMYIMVTIAGHLIVRILLGAIVESKLEKQKADQKGKNK